MITKLLRKNPTEVVRAEEGGYNEWGTSFKDGVHADPPLLAYSLGNVESCGRRKVTLRRDIGVHNFRSLS